MIPVSTIVGMTITVGAQFPPRAGFGILNIVTAEAGVIPLAERIRSYTNIAGVLEDWPATSEAAIAATAYFSQQPKPTQLRISIRDQVNAATSAILLTEPQGISESAMVAIFASISDGEFAMDASGQEEDITALDFSAVTSGDDIAAIVQAGILTVGEFTGATFVWDAEALTFTLTGILSGAVSTLTAFSAVAGGSGTAIQVALLATAANAIVLTQGADATGATETITEALTAISEVNDDWYGFGFTKEVRDLVVIGGEDAVIAASDWAGARVKVFVNTTNALDVLDQLVITDILSLIKAKNARRTMSTYSSSVDEYPSMSIIGRAFTTNFSNVNSTITLKFKQMPGITVEPITQNKKSILDSKRGNALISVGAAESAMFAESYMGDGTFFDELHGLDWLQNAVQTNVFGYLLSRPTKVPYTDKGAAGLEQQIIAALEEGVRNGFLAPGYTIDGEFLPLGYKTTAVPVADVNQSDKDERCYKGLSFVALGANAIHCVEINGVFER